MRDLAKTLAGALATGLAEEGVIATPALLERLLKEALLRQYILLQEDR